MKKEKAWTIAIIVGALFIFVIFVVLTLVNDWGVKGWAIPLGVEVGLFLVGGFIYLVIKFRKKVPEQQEVNTKEAVEFTRKEVLHDEDNPDNLKVGEVKLRRVGAEGKEPTPVLTIYAKGTEMNENRVIIRNMNNYKKEKTSLIDPTKEEIIDGILTIAEYPSTQVTEEIRQSLEHGIPMTYIKRVTPSSTAQKQAIAKEEAEKQTAM